MILFLLCNKLVLDEVVESKGFGQRGMRREKEDEKGESCAARETEKAREN